MADETGQRPSQGQTISNGTVRVLREYNGRGPTKARTYVSGDLVSVVLQDTLTRGEQNLVDGGGIDRVLDLRFEYQKMMRNDLVKLVEETMQRKVIAFMSANHAEPDMAIESFVLAPTE